MGFGDIFTKAGKPKTDPASMVDLKLEANDDLKVNCIQFKFLAFRNNAREEGTAVPRRMQF